MKNKIYVHIAKHIKNNNRKNNMTKQVVFISGGFSGVGRCIGDIFKDKGYHVYGTSRKVTDIENEKWIFKSTKNNGFLRIIPMDICQEESVQQAIQYVFEKEQQIDILINNSGIVTAGAIEDITDQEAFHQFNTNFFGHHRVLRYVLPIMRKQNYGYIFNISSVNGFITLPFQSMYCASKYALESLTESLRIEVAPFNIKAILIEPGDMKTDNTANRTFSKTQQAYQTRFQHSMNIVGKNEQSGPTPIKVAQTILRTYQKKQNPIRIVIGWQYKLFYYAKKFLPSKLVEYVVQKLYS
jgi:short-subunit dehydrogenase